MPVLDEMFIELVHRLRISASVALAGMADAILISALTFLLA
jgi:hypothetical protein